MQSIISTNQRLEPADLHFCRVANGHHEEVKNFRKHQREQFEAKVCRIVKRIFAFSGFLLFLLCLWALR